MAGPTDDEAAAPTRRRTRSDFLANRRALLQAVETLLEERSRDFSLADLATTAGTATATAYRHFPDVEGALEAYYEVLIEGLIAEMAALPKGPNALSRFRAACEVWVRQAAGWGRAAVHVRSWQGFLARLHKGDKLILALHSAMTPLVAALIDAGSIPPQDLDYAVLVWATIFDERVIVDLLDNAHWSVDQTATQLTETVLSALGHAG